MEEEDEEKEELWYITYVCEERHSLLYSTYTILLPTCLPAFSLVRGGEALYVRKRLGGGLLPAFCSLACSMCGGLLLPLLLPPTPRLSGGEEVCFLYV